MRRIPGLFITGTDTGVGKTYVAALIARRLVADGLRVGVYKPAASGCAPCDGRLVSDDAAALWEAAGRPGDFHRVCPQCFAAPLAPHLAAQAEGRRLDPDLLRHGLDYWRERSEIILVEGAGGLMSPMGDDEYVADLAADFGYPLIVVSRNTLGTINQTLQTLIAAATFSRGMLAEKQWGEQGAKDREDAKKKKMLKGLAVAGVVLNHSAPPSDDDPSLAWNRRELVQRCPVPVLAEVGWGRDNFDAPVDWMKLARGQEIASGSLP